MSRGPSRPGHAQGSHPERRAAARSRLARALGAFGRALERRRHAEALGGIVREVEARSPELRSLASEALRARIESQRERLLRSGPCQALLPETFALVREVAERSLGTPHYDVQLMAGWGMARGMLVEMETGEGKTLAATLPACAAALAGIPVHVISANDYLVLRDAEALSPLYHALGLRVAAVTERERDPELRRRAYACDVVYATARQLAFDYLRDRSQRRAARADLARRVERIHGRARGGAELLLRGLCFAVVDEADSVLIDEARTPLVLAGRAQGAPETASYRRALRLAEALCESRDFRLQRVRGEPSLTEAGRARLEELAKPLPAPWSGPRWREELVTQALRALHLLRRDRDYLVRDGRVQIIDGPSGRVAGDRSWERGLHQLLELKERCQPSPAQETLARISYQQFFRRYLHLCGTTATAREVAAELAAVYDLGTLRVPTRLPLRRRALGLRVHATRSDFAEALLARVREVHRGGRPLLIGTGSLAASEELGALLARAGLPHRVLSARQDADEARVVAEAGTRGCVTVATQMAGRGTDVRLAAGVAELGGLHVVSTWVSPARRLDRQLVGRCARQGDPGSFEWIVCLEDDPLPLYFPRALLRWLVRRTPPGRPLTPWLGKLLTRLPQRAEERRHARMRRALVHLEEHLGDLLAFAGPGE